MNKPILFLDSDEILGAELSRWTGIPVENATGVANAVSLLGQRRYHIVMFEPYFFCDTCPANRARKTDAPVPSFADVAYKAHEQNTPVMIFSVFDQERILRDFGLKQGREYDLYVMKPTETNKLLQMIQESSVIPITQ